MKNKGIIIAIVLTAIVSVSSLAQGRKELRFNEVMTQNDSSIIDKYGNRSAWVEIFNRSYGTVGMEQMFISNQAIEIPATGQKPKDYLNDYATKHPDICYEIPRGDKDTKVAPRSHVVFFADGNTAAGSLHLSFKIDAGKASSLYLYDVNGDLVDFVSIPANLPSGSAYALVDDGKSELNDGKADASAWAIYDGATESTAITPGKFNKRVINENIEKFHQNDSHGGILTVTAMGIVFSALLLLFILFYLFGLANKAGNKQVSNKPAPLASLDGEQAASTTTTDDEAMVAICMALYQHLNAHDNESGVLTFNRNDNTAWSSKAGMMRVLPERKN